jgi:glycosyltransferase involved in cell wall biosynthesis
MSARLPISVFIIALNEADRIADTIASVQSWVDEVIVIDSGSTDGTQQVSAARGARVLHHDWQGYGQQKRFGEEQCRNRWILNLDADEVVGEALKSRVHALFAKGGPPAQAYRIPIVEILPGRSRPLPLAHRIVAIRLYDKTHGRFADSTVHDTVRMHSGQVAELHEIIDHRSSRGIAHSIDKLNRYSTMQAQNLHARGRPLAFAHARLLVEFPFAFFKAYVLRCYFLAGWQGFSNAMVYGFSRFARVAKYLEKGR